MGWSEEDGRYQVLWGEGVDREKIGKEEREEKEERKKKKEKEREREERK